MLDISNSQFDSYESTSQVSGNRTTTARPYHHSVTTLPVISADVKTDISAGGATANWAKFALFLMDEGFISEMETEQHPMTLVKLGINNFLEKEVGSFSECGLSLDVTPNIADYYETISVGDSERAIDESNTDLFIRLTPTVCPWYSIGKKLTELETAVPGLGETVYYWLVTEGAGTFNVMSPWAAKNDMAQHTWWYGCETQKEFEGEWEAYNEGDDEEGSVSDCQTSPAAWKAAFPEYANEIKNTLDVEKLKEISETHFDDTIKQIAQLTVRIAETEEFESIGVFGTEYESVSSAMFLLWEDHDLLNRLLDDFFNYANQASDMYTEDLALLVCPVDDRTAMKEMLTNLGRLFKQLKNIEQLVSLIGVRL